MINPCDILTFAEDKSQIISYNNPQFRCFSQEIYFSETAMYQVTEHWHEDLEYLYVKEGVFRCSVSGTTITLHEGEGIFINSKRIHSNGTVRNKRCLLYCAIFHPSYCCASDYIENKYVTPVIKSGTPDYILLQKGDWTEEILTVLTDLFERPASPVLELEVLEASYRILGILYQNIKPGDSIVPSITLYEDTFKTMVTYIGEHYMEKLSLDDIAAAGNIGKTLCAKIFKKYASKTPGDYLVHYRITKSMEWLSDRNRKITDIALSAGFNSASHYTETFRKLIGCTPNQFRNAEKREHITAVANYW